MDIEAVQYTIRFVLAPITAWLFCIFGLSDGNRKRSLLVFAGYILYLTITSYLLIVTMGFYPFSRISALLAFVPSVILIPLVVIGRGFAPSAFMYFTTMNVVLLITLVANFIRSLVDLDLIATIVLIIVLTVPAFVLAMRYFTKPLRFIAQHSGGHWLIMNLVPLLICGLTILLSAYGNVRFHDEPFLATGVSLSFEVIYFMFVYVIYRNLRDIHDLAERLRTEDLVNMQVSAMQQQLNLLDSREQEARIAAHDRRHLDNVLAGLIREGRSDQALGILESDAAPHPLKLFCENTTVNALVSHYADLCVQKDISFEVQLDIPETLGAPEAPEVSERPSVDSLELSIVIANLLENALNACGATGAGTHRKAHTQSTPERYVRFSAVDEGRLLMEVENPFFGRAILDEEGVPLNSDGSRGIGTRSVLAFVERTGGLIDYQVQDGVFRVRLIV